jgi:hypothetical protein
VRTVLLCPFSAGSVLWQTQGGAWTLTVCVRGTFALVHGREAVLADVQEPVSGDRHYADDPRQSLFCASDLALYKPRADIMLVGSAFAPDQVPVEALIARLSLGELDKSIGVIGDRVWIDGPDGPEPSPPRPFTTLPLRYERAARAPDNPVGFDLTRPPVPGALALPNLEAADDEIGRVRTIGFGPVLPAAGTRRGLLGPEGWAWIEGSARGPAPPTFDFAFYNAAPRDQQLDLVRPGTTLLLENLNREHRRLETRLPSVRPKAFLVPSDDPDRGSEIALRCDTVWIDTDRALVTLSWRGVLAVPTPDEEALGALVVAAESKDREIGLKQIAKLFRDGFTSTTTDGDTFSETNPLSVRHDGLRVASPSVPDGSVADDAPRAVTRASAARMPVAAPAPVLIQAEGAAQPLWEELSSSDLFETTSADEPKTLQNIDMRGIEDPLSEEPSTRPVLQGPPAPRTTLTIADFARIAAAAERGDAARVLFEYGLGLPDLPRITRTWTERSAVDATFARTFARELEAARARR